MGFTRSFLKASGLSDEQITAVMEEHVSVVDALKKERDGYKETAEQLPVIQKELDDLKGGEDWHKRFEDEHKAFEDFKGKVAKETEAAKARAAYRNLLLSEGISEKWLDRIMRGVDFDGMKLDKDGNLVDADKLKEALDKEWGDVKTTIVTKGAEVEKPVKTGASKMTREDILRITDTAARQKAIAENLDLFQKG